MARRIKVLTITEGMHLECIKIVPKSGEKVTNPYRLYLLYHARDCNGYPAIHRKQLAAYSDFYSIVCHIKDIMVTAGWNIEDILSWNKRYYHPYPFN